MTETHAHAGREEGLTVGVKEQQDEVATRCKPSADLDEVIGPLNALLLTAEDARGVHQCNFLEELAGALGALKLGEEAGTKDRETLDGKQPEVASCSRTKENLSSRGERWVRNKESLVNQGT